MKRDRQRRSQESLRKCADLTEGLLAVPHDELERKLKQHKRKKGQTNKSS